MTRAIVERAGPMMTLQDLGREGHIAAGLSRGGAMDRCAILEATALLAAPQPLAAIEMAGVGGVFRAEAPVRFALTGAPMQAQIDGIDLAWNATHLLPEGGRLVLGGARDGTYGYLTFAGGIAGPASLGGQGAHLAAGLGRPLIDGEILPVLPDPAPTRAPHRMDGADRFSGGLLRRMPGPQTALFDLQTRTRFAATTFLRSAQANRQGLRLDHSGAPFAPQSAANLISDAILCGDAQMTVAARPYVLMAECQTIGDCPWIGTVIDADLGRAAQAPVDAELRFEWITVAEADALFQSDAEILAGLRDTVRPLTRDIADIRDLLSYQLFGGATCGDDLERHE